MGAQPGVDEAHKGTASPATSGKQICRATTEPSGVQVEAVPRGGNCERALAFAGGESTPLFFWFPVVSAAVGASRADGKAVAYPVADNSVDNVWIQPIDGGPVEHDT